MNKLLDRFEAQISAGKTSPIEDWLGQVTPNQRAECFGQLVAIEVFYRDKRGEAVKPSDYLDRFPEYPREIDQAFGELEKLKPSIDPTLKHPVPNPGSRASPTRMIGPYKLLEPIGEGGMGTVWMAEQEKPVRRRVALKLIKSEFASPELIARFDAERQALAIMNHPNIARILDAGTTSGGQPFFVMEHVAGTALTTYCDTNRLGIDDRLRLFSDVCAGVQHAHQKGVIHRDLKPGNIIVGLQDGVPVPKIIDFGLAKAMESTMRLTDQSLFTGAGRILGTLKYMSPEQAGLNSLDIDTRTDIYALGVILYELLTGSTPLDDTSIKDRAAMEILEWIRDRDPVKPSSQLSNSTNEHISTITSKRKTDRSSLNQILAGDLDWIVMKALEKDRTRRYESASGFADDIRRYLNSEPVIARPPSLNYRMKKFVRKNRAGVIAASLVVTALVVGLAATSWQMRRAQIAERDAKYAKEKAEANERMAIKAKKEADAQKNESEKMRLLADSNFEQAWDAITSLSKLGEDPRLRQRGVEPLRREILTEAKVFYSQLVANEPDKSLPWKNQLRRLNSLFELTELEEKLGDRSAAIEALNNAKKQLDLIGEPANERVRMFSAYVARRQGRFYSARRQFDEADLEFQRADRIIQSIPAGQYSQEKLLYEQALNELARVNSRIMKQDYKNCDAPLDRAISILEEITSKAEFNDSFEVLQHLGGGYEDKSTLQRLRKETVAAQDNLRKAANIFRQLWTRHPEEAFSGYRYAMCLRTLANWQADSLELTVAANDMQESIQIMKQVVEKFPGIIEYRLSLAEVHAQLADIYILAEKPQLVDDPLERAKELFDRLPNDSLYPEFVETRNAFLVSFGDGKLLQRKFLEAKEGYEQVIPRLRQILEADPTNIRTNMSMLKSISGLGRALAGIGDFEAAAVHGETLVNLGQGHFGERVLVDGAVIIGLAAIAASENGSDRAEDLKEEYFQRSSDLIKKTRKKQQPLADDFPESFKDFDQFKSKLEGELKPVRY